jgi:hypothetical protein
VTAPYDIRELRIEDHSFIVGAWVSSFLERVRAVVAADAKRALRESIVTVACDRQDPDTLCGFAAVDGDSLLYTYVKGPLRREGIARALLEPHGIRSYGYRTDQGESRLRIAERGWEYRPRIVL